MTRSDAQNAAEQGSVGARAGTRWRRMAARGVGLALLAVVLYYVGKHLRRDLAANPWRELSVRPAYLVAALASLLGARAMNGLNCRHLLAAMGCPLPPRRVMAVIWIASLGRYMPGKVAVVAGSALMLVRMGARLPVAAAALFLSTALMILMGLVFSTPLMFMAEFRRVLPSAPVFALLVLGVGMGCLYPPVFLRLCNVVLRRIKREPLPDRLHAGPFWAAIGMTALRSVLLGLALWLTALALAPVGMRTIPLFLASAGLASVIGFVAVFAPAGLGVHEGVYRATLIGVVGSPIGWLVVLFRLLHVAADVVAAGAGMVLMRFDGEVPAAAEDGPRETAAVAEGTK